MLKPVEMKRLMIVGPNELLNETIEALHEAAVLQFADTAVEEGGIFREGKPLEGATESSYRLLRIRAAKQILGPPKENDAPRFTEEEIDSGMGGVMSAVDEILDSYKQKQALLEVIRSLEEKKAQIEPLCQFPVPLEHYRGLESVVSFVGTVNSQIATDIGHVTDRYELFAPGDGRFIALFVERRSAGEVRSLLSSFEFKEFLIPDLQGDPRDRVKEIEERITAIRLELSSLQERMERLSEQNVTLLNAAEEVVSASVSKAEAPLHFSLSEREFVARGWVPSEELDGLTLQLAEKTGGRVFIAEEPAAAPGEADSTEQESPPVKLRNTSVSRPYELLVRLFSLPEYGEYDPTAVVAVTFALFVGLMINDLGYGILMIITGYILVLYFRDSRDMRQLAYILITSGAAGALFGYFVFGLAFGLPITGTPLLNPEDFHVAEGLLLLCVIIGLLHMGLGYAFRLSGSISGREYRKAAASAGWIAVLLGFVTIMAGIGKGNLPIGATIWKYMFFWAGGPTLNIATLSVPGYSIALIAGGLALLIATEGAFALLESISLLANVISYARLAAIAIAGAALAGAINLMLMPHSFGENPLMYVLGLLMLILAQIFVFIMLTLSASIQALRLNYIEFFVKFFRGGGRAYRPFGMSRKYTTER